MNNNNEQLLSKLVLLVKIVHKKAKNKMIVVK